MTRTFRPSRLTRPGQSLFIARNTIDLLQRCRDLTAMTGPTEILLCPAVSIPLPNEHSPGNHPRTPAADPAAMWHPLLWLPPALTKPHTFTIDDGTGGAVHTPEPDDLRAARIANTLTSSGLYDPTTGMWLDVLDRHGLNITNPATVDRVAHWLEGHSDNDLDAIDLSALLAPADQMDDITAMDAQVLRSCGSAALAADMVHLLREAANDREDSLIDTLRTIACIGHLAHLDGEPLPRKCEPTVWDRTLLVTAAAINFPFAMTGDVWRAGADLYDALQRILADDGDTLRIFNALGGHGPQRHGH